MPTSSPDAEQSKLISDAIKLAMDISTEGVDNLSKFLSGITRDVGSMAGKADDQLNKISQERRDEFAARGGRLANDAISAALDVALAASKEANNDQAQRERNLNALSQLASFFGSMFIDTANKAVGTTAGQPAMNRPRQITLEVAPNGEAKASAWVVNRGAGAVTAAPVRVLVADDAGLQFECEPPEVTIGPRGRCSITLTVKRGPGARPARSSTRCSWWKAWPASWCARSSRRRKRPRRRRLRPRHERRLRAFPRPRPRPGRGGAARGDPTHRA